MIPTTILATCSLLVAITAAEGTCPSQCSISSSITCTTKYGKTPLTGPLPTTSITTTRRSRYTTIKLCYTPVVTASIALTSTSTVELDQTSSTTLFTPTTITSTIYETTTQDATSLTVVTSTSTTYDGPSPRLRRAARSFYATSVICSEYDVAYFTCTKTVTCKPRSTYTPLSIIYTTSTSVTVATETNSTNVQVTSTVFSPTSYTTIATATSIDIIAETDGPFSTQTVSCTLNIGGSQVYTMTYGLSGPSNCPVTNGNVRVVQISGTEGGQQISIAPRDSFGDNCYYPPETENSPEVDLVDENGVGYYVPGESEHQVYYDSGYGYHLIGDASIAYFGRCVVVM